MLHVIPRHARPAPGPSPERRLSEVLARHGIAAELIAEPSLDLDPADLLLNQAADSGADLIVMGAYGRSRVRELVLGGVTRGVLQHMTVPVLLSH